MSTKRESNEFSCDEDSDLLLREVNSAKRLKLDSQNEATIRDLPIEVLVRILVRVVAMEVIDMKLPKSSWKGKSELVMNRLQAVCVQWNDVLATDFFRNEVYRTLDGFGREMTIRVEMVRHPMKLSIRRLAGLKDELFIVCGLHHRYCTSCSLKVYDYSDLTMAKEVISLDRAPVHMAGCSVSNCVYLLYKNKRCASIARVAKGECRFSVSPWIKNLRVPSLDLGPISVTANGSVITVSRQASPKPTIVGIYGANGSIQHKMKIFPEVHGLTSISSAFQRYNGNFVLVSAKSQYEAKLLEIDMNERVLHSYQSSLPMDNFLHSYHSSLPMDGFSSFEDMYGKIFVYHLGSRLELLDCEYKVADIEVLQQQMYCTASPGVCYNSERHEMMFSEYTGRLSSALVILRFTRA